MTLVDDLVYNSLTLKLTAPGDARYDSDTWQSG